MSDIEVLAAVVVVLAVLGWAAAGMGWLEGSVTVRVIPPAKRPEKPGDKPEPAAAVDEPVPLREAS